MKPKNKNLSPPLTIVPRPVKPLILHDLTNQTPSAIAASRRRMIATSFAASTDHARHHIARNAQS